MQPSRQNGSDVAINQGMQQSLKAGKGKEQVLPLSICQCGPANNVISARDTNSRLLDSKTLREYISVVLNYGVVVIILGTETNTVMIRFQFSNYYSHKHIHVFLYLPRAIKNNLIRKPLFSHIIRSSIKVNTEITFKEINLQVSELFLKITNRFFKKL